MLLTRLQLAIAGAVVAILLVIAAVQTVRLQGFLWVDGALDELADTRRDLNEAHAALKEAHDAAVAQQAETERLMKLNRERQTQANGKAERIEKAVLPGNCKTPDEIMRAEI